MARFEWPDKPPGFALRVLLFYKRRLQCINRLIEMSSLKYPKGLIFRARIEH
jgi:hypothetical protein